MAFWARSSKVASKPAEGNPGQELGFRRRPSSRGHIKQLAQLWHLPASEGGVAPLCTLPGGATTSCHALSSRQLCSNDPSRRPKRARARADSHQVPQPVLLFPALLNEISGTPRQLGFIRVDSPPPTAPPSDASKCKTRHDALVDR